MNVLNILGGGILVIIGHLGGVVENGNVRQEDGEMEVVVWRK